MNNAVLTHLGKLDQLFTLLKILKGAWEFGRPFYMCLVDLETAFYCVPLSVLWEVLREFGVSSPLLQAI